MGDGLDNATRIMIESAEFAEALEKENLASLFTLTEQEACDLHKFLFDVGYISYEFHAPMHDIFKKLREYVESRKVQE